MARVPELARGAWFWQPWIAAAMTAIGHLSDLLIAVLGAGARLGEDQAPATQPAPVFLGVGDAVGVWLSCVRGR